MRRVALIALALLSGCGAADGYASLAELNEADNCAFRGAYTMVFEPLAPSDRCRSALDRASVTDSGLGRCHIRAQGFGFESGAIACEPGDPVTQCHGESVRVHGCEGQVWLSREEGP